MAVQASQKFAIPRYTRSKIWLAVPPARGLPLNPFILARHPICRGTQTMNTTRKTLLVSLSAIAALSLSLSAAADCIYPKAPAKIPDGKTATKEDMLAAQAAFKQLDADVNAYNACLDQETEARLSEGGEQLPKDQVAQIKAIQAKRHNAAVDELQTHADAFNEQVRAYQKAHSKG
jgi:hypothetical protein